MRGLVQACTLTCMEVNISVTVNPWSIHIPCNVLEPETEKASVRNVPHVPHVISEVVKTLAFQAIGHAFRIRDGTKENKWNQQVEQKVQ